MTVRDKARRPTASLRLIAVSTESLLHRAFLSAHRSYKTPDDLVSSSWIGHLLLPHLDDPVIMGFVMRSGCRNEQYMESESHCEMCDTEEAGLTHFETSSMDSTSSTSIFGR